jgi:diguanylate cyclase (GGDEF)-like protein
MRRTRDRLWERHGHTREMATDTHELRLRALTRLGHRLPAVSSAEAAAQEVVRALGSLDLGASVLAVDADQAVVVAFQVVPGPNPSLTRLMVARLLGMRIPLDRVEAFRRTVRRRRPYLGAAGIVDTVRSLTTDSALARALPDSSNEGEMLAVPAMARDKVVAIVAAWGPGCSKELVPTLEAAAAMLAGAWATEARPTMSRFASRSTSKPSAHLRSAVGALLEDGGMAAALQPIVRLFDRNVIGYEALTRFPPSTDFATPDELFATASSVHMESSVDLACLRAALCEAPHLAGANLFVNVLIGTLLDERRGLAELESAVHAARLDPSSIVLEFSERDPVPDLARLQRIATQLRSRGYRIAVDDAGAGHASMQVIAELRPEFIKVDRSLVHALDADRARRGLMVSLLSFSGHIGARLIAEGIETERELETLLSVGIEFGQGWLLGRPVLTKRVEGLRDIEVVDGTWFAQRQEARIPAAPARAAVLVESQIITPRSSNRVDLPRALSDAALALQSEHDPMRILGVMAEEMNRVVPVAEMAIYIGDYAMRRFVPVFASGPDREALLAETFSINAGITGWAFAKGTPENIDDTSAHPLARQVPGTAVVQESLLLIPLIAGDHKLGIINCYRLGVGRFDASELEAATLFAHIAAAAWRNAQLYTELVNAAMTDPLTGLYNSRWLRDAGEREIAASARDHTKLSLLLMDLDHFKKVNDSSGHAAGDQVLQRLAIRLRSSVRGADAVVRFGGEEFVVLLHGSDAAGAASAAEALRVAVQEVALPQACDLRRLTASIGIAVYPDDGHVLDQLLAAADRAMYAAKHGGRDQVARAPSAAEPGAVVTLPRRPRTASRRRTPARERIGSPITHSA